VADRRLLAVFAHPDDESFRPGGTLALLARGGVRVQVLTAIRGEAGARWRAGNKQSAWISQQRLIQALCGYRPALLGQLQASNAGRWLLSEVTCRFL